MPNLNLNASLILKYNAGHLHRVDYVSPVLDGLSPKAPNKPDLGPFINYCDELISRARVAINEDFAREEKRKVKAAKSSRPLPLDAEPLPPLQSPLDVIKKRDLLYAALRQMFEKHAGKNYRLKGEEKSVSFERLLTDKVVAQDFSGAIAGYRNLLDDRSASSQRHEQGDAKAKLEMFKEKDISQKLKIFQAASHYFFSQQHLAPLEQKRYKAKGNAASQFIEDLRQLNVKKVKQVFTPYLQNLSLESLVKIDDNLMDLASEQFKVGTAITAGEILSIQTLQDLVHNIRIVKQVSQLGLYHFKTDEQESRLKHLIELGLEHDKMREEHFHKIAKVLYPCVNIKGDASKIIGQILVSKKINALFPKFDFKAMDKTQQENLKHFLLDYRKNPQSGAVETHKLYVKQQAAEHVLVLDSLKLAPEEDWLPVRSTYVGKFRAYLKADQVIYLEGLNAIASQYDLNKFQLLKDYIEIVTLVISSQQQPELKAHTPRVVSDMNTVKENAVIAAKQQAVSEAAGEANVTLRMAKKYYEEKTTEKAKLKQVREMVTSLFVTTSDKVGLLLDAITLKTKDSSDQGHKVLIEQSTAAAQARTLYNNLAKAFEHKDVDHSQFVQEIVEKDSKDANKSVSFFLSEMIKNSSSQVEGVKEAALAVLKKADYSLQAREVVYMFKELAATNNKQEEFIAWKNRRLKKYCKLSHLEVAAGGAPSISPFLEAMTTVDKSKLSNEQEQALKAFTTKIRDKIRANDFVRHYLVNAQNRSGALHAYKTGRLKVLSVDAVQYSAMEYKVTEDALALEKLCELPAAGRNFHSEQKVGEDGTMPASAWELLVKKYATSADKEKLVKQLKQILDTALCPIDEVEKVGAFIRDVTFYPEFSAASDKMKENNYLHKDLKQSSDPGHMYRCLNEKFGDHHSFFKDKENAFFCIFFDHFAKVARSTGLQKSMLPELRESVVGQMRLPSSTTALAEVKASSPSFFTSDALICFHNLVEPASKAFLRTQGKKLGSDLANYNNVEKSVKKELSILHAEAAKDFFDFYAKQQLEKFSEQKARQASDQFINELAEEYHSATAYNDNAENGSLDLPQSAKEDLFQRFETTWQQESDEVRRSKRQDFNIAMRKFANALDLPVQNEKYKKIVAADEEASKQVSEAAEEARRQALKHAEEKHTKTLAAKSSELPPEVKKPDRPQATSRPAPFVYKPVDWLGDHITPPSSMPRLPIAEEEKTKELWRALACKDEASAETLITLSGLAAQHATAQINGDLKAGVQCLTEEEFKITVIKELKQQVERFRDDSTGESALARWERQIDTILLSFDNTKPDILAQRRKNLFIHYQEYQQGSLAGNANFDISLLALMLRDSSKKILLDKWFEASRLEKYLGSESTLSQDEKLAVIALYRSDVFPKHQHPNVTRFFASLIKCMALLVSFTIILFPLAMLMKMFADNLALSKSHEFGFNKNVSPRFFQLDAAYKQYKQQANVVRGDDALDSHGNSPEVK